MKNRNWVASLVLGIAAIGFAGCGGEETAPPPDTNTPDTIINTDGAADAAAPADDATEPAADMTEPAADATAETP